MATCIPPDVDVECHEKMDILFFSPRIELHRGNGNIYEWSIVAGVESGTPLDIFFNLVAVRFPFLSTSAIDNISNVFTSFLDDS